jgi:hypothetical protein
VTAQADEDVAESANGAQDLRTVPISWEALEDAFENNAPEVHSYLHLQSGEVIRVVDGIADPAMHSRIAEDAAYQRIDPVSSREQYRWMEHFIATVEDGLFRQKLVQAIDGKGAFRRFKDVLMSFPVDRERWFQFRSERLRTCMEAWLGAHGLAAREREEWEVPSAEDVGGKAEADSPPKIEAQKVSQADLARGRLHEMVDGLPARELEMATTFLDFLRERRPLPRPDSKAEGNSRPGK